MLLCAFNLLTLTLAAALPLELWRQNGGGRPGTEVTTFKYKWQSRSWPQLSRFLGGPRQQWSSEEDKVQKNFHPKAHHIASQEDSQKRHCTSKTRRGLEARQTDGISDADYDFYYERAKQYQREFRNHKDLRAARDRGEGTKEQLKYYNDLRKDFNTYNRLRRERTLGSKPRTDPATIASFSSEYVDYLHERHRELDRLKRHTDQEMLTKLKKGDPSVPTELLKEYKSLVHDSKEYMKWYKLQRRKSSPKEYSPQTKAILDANHKAYLKYTRTYTRGPVQQAEAARLKALPSDSIERKAFDVLWNAYKKYLVAMANHLRPAGTVVIEYSEQMDRVIHTLEATREQHNEFQKRFKTNKALREKMEAGHGTKAELAEYQTLKEAYKAHRRAYIEGFKMTRRAGLVNGAADEGRKVKIEVTGGGKPRWYRPNADTRRRMKKNSKVLPKKAEGSGGSDGGAPPGTNDENRSGTASTNTSPEDDDQNQDQSTRSGTGASDSESTTQAGSDDTQPPPLQSSTSQLRRVAPPFSPTASPRGSSDPGWPSRIVEVVRKIDPGTVVTDALAGLAVLGTKVWDSLRPLY